MGWNGRGEEKRNLESRDEQTKSPKESEIQIESKKKLITARRRLAEHFLCLPNALEALFSSWSSEKTVHTLNLIFDYFSRLIVATANDQLT